MSHRQTNPYATVGGIGGAKAWSPPPEPVAEMESIRREWARVDAAIDDAKKGYWRPAPGELDALKKTRSELETKLERR